MCFAKTCVLDVFSICWACSSIGEKLSQGYMQKNVFCQNLCFGCVFNLLGLFICIGEKLSQGYMQKSFLVIVDYKKIWNRAKTIFLVRVQHCPPHFCLPVVPWKAEDHSFLHVLLVWGVTLTNLLIKKHQSWAFVLRYYF